MTEIEEEYISICPACGSVIDYCQGHGEIGDPSNAAILALHDGGYHFRCHENSTDCHPPIVGVCGTSFNFGDRAFNHYDREFGTIGDECGQDGWFRFVQDNGRTCHLNGDRICSQKYAVKHFNVSTLS